MNKDLSQVVTKASYIYSIRKNANYGPSDVIDFYITPSHQLVNTKSTFLVFNLQMKGNMYKSAVSGSAGVEALFRQITISDGTGSTVLETIPAVGHWSAKRRTVTSTHSSDNLAYLHEGMPNKMTICHKDATCNQYCDATKGDGNHNKIVEICLPFHLSGILTPQRNKVLANLATRGLRISMELNTVERATEVIKAQVLQGSDSGNVELDEYGGYEEDKCYRLREQTANGSSVLKLMNTGDALDAGQKAVLSGNSPTPAHLFCPGQSIVVTGVAGEKVIESIAVNANVIELTVTSPFTADLPAKTTQVYISNDASHYGDNSFEISSMKMQVGDVIAPPAYMSHIESQIKRGVFKYDYTAVQDFVKNIPEGSKNNALVLNSLNTRGKSLIVIPEDDEHSNSPLYDTFAPCKIEPQRFELNNYNLQFGSKMSPDRMINLTAYNNKLHDPVCLREQLHAIDAAGWEPNNIKDIHEHFFIGRRLALKGYSMDLNPNPITVNLNFKSNPLLNVHCFLVHKRQVQVRDGGVNVVY